jgi:hypothetical protein
VWRGGIAADGLGNVYISGSTNAPIEAPRSYVGYDAFLAKYDADGNRVWIREFGTVDGSDYANGVALDGLGNVYVVGSSGGDLGGPNAGGTDAFLAKFDASGSQYWIHQFGTTAGDSANFISADGLGNVYIAGSTAGELGGPYTNGGSHIFLAKFGVGVPEPSAAFLLLIAATLANAFIRNPRPRKL